MPKTRLRRCLPRNGSGRIARTPETPRCRLSQISPGRLTPIGVSAAAAVMTTRRSIPSPPRDSRGGNLSCAARGRQGRRRRAKNAASSNRPAAPTDSGRRPTAQPHRCRRPSRPASRCRPPPGTGVEARCVGAPDVRSIGAAVAGRGVGGGVLAVGTLPSGVPPSAGQSSSVVPSQSSSRPLHASVAPGWTSGFPSSQSVPAGCPSSSASAGATSSTTISADAVAEAVRPDAVHPPVAAMGAGAPSVPSSARPSRGSLRGRRSRRRAAASVPPRRSARRRQKPTCVVVAAGPGGVARVAHRPPLDERLAGAEVRAVGDRLRDEIGVVVGRRRGRTVRVVDEAARGESRPSACGCACRTVRPRTARSRVGCRRRARSPPIHVAPAAARRARLADEDAAVLRRGPVG